MEALQMVLTILSLALGIGNTLYIYFWQNRVHLKVTVRISRVYNAAGIETEARILRWNIANASTFAVYLDEIGFCDRNNASELRVPLKFISKRTNREPIEFPYRLESREGVELEVSHSSQTEELRKHERIYVKTCCGYRTFVKIPIPIFL